MLIALGSCNPAKVSAVKIGFKKVFPNEKIKVLAISVKSGISNQPMSDTESIKGAINRATKAQKQVPGADYAVGMEGGVHKIGKNWFESGWIAIIDKQGKIGLGTSARWQVSANVQKRLNGKNELAQIFQELAKIENAKDTAGVMGLITKNLLPRDIAYSHGVIFALAPFHSNPIYWD